VPEPVAVVFDLDGVLIDSEPVWEQVRRGLVAERGGHWADDAQQRLMGMSTPEWARYLSDDLGVGLPPDQVARTVVDRMAAHYADAVPVIDGADAAIRRIAARWRLGLASSSPRRLIDAVLAVTGWGTLVEVSVSTEEVARGKPEPDCYLRAADLLGVTPARCVAVEDSSNGLRSAAAAGLPVIAVPRPEYPPAPDALTASAAVLTDLRELTTEAVRRAASRTRSDPPGSG
jgi:HAD superfamily hydrolase (TIGR01509 family)